MCLKQYDDVIQSLGQAENWLYNLLSQTVLLSDSDSVYMLPFKSLKLLGHFLMILKQVSCAHLVLL